MCKKIVLLVVLCFLAVISCSSPNSPNSGNQDNNIDIGNNGDSGQTGGDSGSGGNDSGVITPTNPTEEGLLIEKYGININQDDAEISRQIEEKLKEYYKDNKTYKVIFTGTTENYGRHESLYNLTLKAAVKINSSMNIDMDIQNINFQNGTINSDMFSGYVVDNSENIFINIIFPQDKIKTIAMHAFTCIYNTKEILIPDSVINIGSYAFQQAKKLEKLTLSKNLETIGNSAFSYSAVEELVIPESVISIGSGAFANSSKLLSLTIPASVTSIGDHAFASCLKLITVTYNGTLPYLLKNNDTILYFCNSLRTLIVPNAVDPSDERWKTFLGGKFIEVKKQK